MPGTKHRTKRRNKRKPPYRAITRTSRAQKDSVSTVNLGTTPLISTTTPAATVSLQMSTSTPQTTPTATQKKLSKSPHASHLLDHSTETEFDNFEGQGVRILEVKGLQSALQSVCCKICKGSISFQENFNRQQGLYTAPCLVCGSCENVTHISFSRVGNSKVLALNLKMVLASKLAGENLSAIKMLCAFLDLPHPVTKNTYTSHTKAIETV